MTRSMNKNTTKRNKKADDAKLAKGAAKIQKAQKEKTAKRVKKKPETAPPLEPVVIPESTRPIQDIIRERVTVLDGHIGLKLADDTPLEESLRILDWTTTMSDHVGFMVGDVLNFGEKKFGEKYKAALIQTGRAYTTLRRYSSVAAQFPPEQRVAKLSFSHHKELVALELQTRNEVLLELKEKAEKGSLPSKEELRIKVQKLTPKKKKTPKKVTSGKKGKTKKVKPEPPPYEPTKEEQSVLDSIEGQLIAVAQGFKQRVTRSDGATTLSDGKPRTAVYVVLECDNKEKKRWLDLLWPLFNAYNTIDRCTGY